VHFVLNYVYLFIILLSGFWSQRRAIVIQAALDLRLFLSPAVIFFRPQSLVCAGWLTTTSMHSVLEMIDGHCWHLVAHEVLCSLTWNVVRGSQWPIFLLYTAWRPEGENYKGNWSWIEWKRRRDRGKLTESFRLPAWFILWRTVICPCVRQHWRV